MALAKIADLYPNYQEDIFGGGDIKSFSVYDYTNDKIGSVHDIIVDDTGRFRYLVIDTGFWIFGKKVLLPVGRASIDYSQERVYASGLTKEQAENLPEYDSDMTIDYDYEEKVRMTYRGKDYDTNSPVYSQQANAYNSGVYSDGRNAQLYDLNSNNHGNIVRYEQNLINNRDRFNLKSGVNLYKIGDIYPDYRNLFDNDDLLSYSLYSNNEEKVGSVEDILVDRDGHFRYLVVDTGFWIFGKKVLLPFGRARIDRNQKRVYATGLTKEQAEHLPEYNSDMTVDYDYEENVRNVYRDEYSGVSTSTSSSYDYDREPSLYSHQETDGRQSLKLYEERLVANKERFRTGTVTVGKKVETETATVSVPIEKEKIIIERSNPTDSTAVTPGATAFNEGEVARVEVYEESAEIEKQAFVREEVSVRKEVEKDTVSARETIRREELDIETDGEGLIDNDR
ncbi:DUF2382 domain-containing protein [Pleurocapsa sp. PCC 7319]|uniref:DUF2382 domain-containing protein n=1 Tax=Pleurocapsa sp. PCC 7319 TaxID=118161 RepID=UPI000349945D|nr:DUF2382 domain-containing protein [Pleurocapsa sp. PCC 7319]